LAFNCDASGIDQDGGASLLDEDQAFRILRSVKPLRIFRMLKTLKAVAAINIGSIYGSSTAIMLAQTFRIPSFVLRVGQVLFVLSLLVHTSACMFWLIKTDVTPADEIDDWMIRNNLSIHLHASLSEKYVAAVYFVFTIFTTVGFGDMVPESTSERRENLMASHVARLAANIVSFLASCFDLTSCHFMLPILLVLHENDVSFCLFPSSVGVKFCCALLKSSFWIVSP
jgi:CBS domain containing-hemolysin-like protein